MNTLISNCTIMNNSVVAGCPFKYIRYNILVMPRFDSKNMQLAKDFTQILYQIAVATKVAVGL